MKIELRKIADVHPYPNNPRINDDAVDAVATSIREFGFQQPIIGVDRHDPNREASPLAISRRIAL